MLLHSDWFSTAAAKFYELNKLILYHLYDLHQLHVCLSG